MCNRQRRAIGRVIAEESAVKRGWASGAETMGANNGWQRHCAYRSNPFTRALRSSSPVFWVGLIATAGLVGCTPADEEYSCSPPGLQPEICVDVSAASPLQLNLPIMQVITLRSSSDIQDVGVTANIAPMSSQLGKIDEDLSWVVDLTAGVSTRLAFSVEIYQPGFYTLTAWAFLPDYHDPVSDVEHLDVGVATSPPVTP